MIRITDTGTGAVRLTTQPVAGIYPKGSIDISIQKGEGDVDIARSESTPYVAANDRVIIKRRGIQVAGGRASEFEDSTGTAYASATAMKAALDAFFFQDVTCNATPLTPTQLIAEDTDATLSPCTNYSTEFIGGDGLTHTIFYYGAFNGKFPGFCLMVHANGEAYNVSCIPQPAGTSPIVYAVDTVEVYSCQDFRGNNVAVSGYYIEAQTLNPLWKFWWGDYRVQGNVLTNSSVSSTSGLLTIEPGETAQTSVSRFLRNTLTNTSVDVQNDPVNGRDGVITIVGNTFERCQVSIGPGNGTWKKSSNVEIMDCNLTAASAVALSSFYNLTLSGVIGTEFSINPTDTELSMTGCRGTSSQIISTGTGAIAENVTFQGGAFIDTAIEAHPPVAGQVTYTSCKVQGWANVVLDPSVSHKGLQLDTKIEGGRTVYTSNLTVTKNAKNAAHFSSNNLILDQPQDQYAGEILFDGLSSNPIAHTGITTITRTVQPDSGKSASLRITAGLNASNSAPAYFRISFEGAVTDPPTAHRVIGTGSSTLSNLNARRLGSSYHLLLRTDMPSPYWVLERTEVYS